MNKIYILKLTNYKYYIGKTKRDVNIRFIEHFEGHGSIWTRTYEPLSIEKIIDKCDDFDEDKWTKIYMRIYGINNVRGGTYSKIILEGNEIELLTKELNHSEDKCLYCGEYGHFIKYCQKKTNTVSAPIINHKHMFDCNACGKSYTTQKGLRYHQTKYCQKKTNTVSAPIINNEHMFECKMCGKSYTTQKGLRYHQTKYCQKKTNTVSHIIINYNHMFECNACGKSYTTQKGLRYHQTKYCQKKTNTVSHIIINYNHMFECNACGKSYTTRKGLRYHQTKYCQKTKRYRPYYLKV